MDQSKGEVLLTAVDSDDVYKTHTKDDLREGAKKFEMFWLRPKRYSGEIIPVRSRLTIPSAPR